MPSQQQQSPSFEQMDSAFKAIQSKTPQASAHRKANMSANVDLDPEMLESEKRDGTHFRFRSSQSPSPNQPERKDTAQITSPNDSYPADGRSPQNDSAMEYCATTVKPESARRKPSGTPGSSIPGMVTIKAGKK